MKLDRTAFLSLVTVLSAVACAAPADDAGEQSGATTGTNVAAACVDPNVDRGLAPTAEGCRSMDSYGQCEAWVSHFRAGIARSALDRTNGGAEAYEAGYAALTSTCKGSDAEEKKLATFCGKIADAQVAATKGKDAANIYNIRGPGFTFKGSKDRAELEGACKNLVRGMKVESRVLVRRCIEKTPEYDVYGCVEGLGFDNARSKCEDTNAVASGGAPSACNSAVANECSNMKSLLKAKPDADTRSCILESEIILTEDGSGVTGAAMQQAVQTCALGTIARACEASDARAACDMQIFALASADPQLTAKGHLNAGGAFTKRCLKTMSALTPSGQVAVSQCIQRDAEAVTRGAVKMNDISLDKCVMDLVRAKG